MRKIISLILLLSLLSAQLLGCTFIDNLIQKMPHEEIIPEKDKSHLENIGKPIDPIVINEGELDKSGALVATLLAYLDMYNMHIDPIPKSFSQQIDDVKSGIQPLHVAFDPDSYYFVCAYYDTADDHYEKFDFCCVNEYTWVCYKNESLIKEYYNDMECIITFQINLASTITDIVSSDRSVPDIQHFQIYKTMFENGLNVQESVVFDKTFIYLNYPNLDLNAFPESKSTVYYCESVYYRNIATIPCANLDGDYYLTFFMNSIYGDGKESWSYDGFIDYCKYNFGEYYNELSEVIQYGKYTVTNNNSVSTYAVISIEDFFDVLVE